MDRKIPVRVPVLTRPRTRRAREGGVVISARKWGGRVC
jgi:hypothetical protein